MVVFSKSYCPYASKAKQTLQSEGAVFHIVELDQRGDGSTIQAALADMTGRRTVPNGTAAGGGTADCMYTEKGGDWVTGSFNKHQHRFVYTNPTHTPPLPPLPAVFLNGKTIGGGDDTVALARSGKLRQMLSELGALKK